MVAATEAMLTSEIAGDPRSYVGLAEGICDDTMGDDGTFAAVDGKRALEVVGRVCQMLTRRTLHEAQRVDMDPIEWFREQMADAESDIAATERSFQQVAKHWLDVEDRFGDRPPEIPATASYVTAEDELSERMLRRAQKHLNRIIQVTNLMLTGEITPVDAQRKLDMVETACLMLTGQEMGDVADRWTSPLRRFIGPLGTSAQELMEVRRAYHALDGVSDAEAAMWDAQIDRVLALQHQARHDPARFMVYVYRDADPSRAGQVLELEWFHVSWFGVWFDTEHPHSLVMAPPGHGKTFCFSAAAAFEVGNHPELRCLLLFDEARKLTKEVLRLKGIMTSPPYRAIFPHIRVLGRQDNERDTQEGFAVGRRNQLFSREPTIEGASIFGNINGNGYDRIWGDDFSMPQCREEPNQRARVCTRFTNVVEERLRDDADSRIRLIHTPWHPEDAVGRIRTDVAKGNLPLWRVQINPYAIREDRNGDPIPLWPRKRNVRYLKERRWRLGRDYLCCYALQATDTAQKALHRVHYYNATQQNVTSNDSLLFDALSQADRTLSIDPAGSDARAASDTGVIDGRLTTNGYGFVTDVWFLHLAPVKLLDWVIDRLVVEYEKGQPYQTLLVEAQGGIKGMVSTWQDLVPKRLAERGIPADKQPAFIAPGTRVGQGHAGQNRGKFKRLRESAPYIEKGCVRFAGRRVRRPGRVAAATEAIPGSDLAVLAGMLIEFDGTTKFDAGDALCQWILFNKSAFRDPFFTAARAPAPPTRPTTDPMAMALGRQLEAMRNPPKPDTSGETDLSRMYSKFSPTPERHVA